MCPPGHIGLADRFSSDTGSLPSGVIGLSSTTTAFLNWTTPRDWSPATTIYATGLTLLLISALKDAEEIEYALAFDDSGEGINAIQHKKKQSERQDTPALSQTLEALTKRIESLETTLQMNAKAQGSFHSKRGGRRQAITLRTRKVGPCYNCGQEGHLSVSKLSFKLSRASTEGGRQLAPPLLTHHQNHTSYGMSYNIKYST